MKNIIITCLATCLSLVAMAQDYSLTMLATIDNVDDSKATLDVFMTNKETVSAIQFDLYMSEQTDVFYGKNVDGDMAYLISKGERAKTNHTVSYKKIADRTYRVIISSPKNDTFKETEANRNKPVASIIMDVNDVPMNAEVKPEIKNIVLSHYDTTTGDVAMYYPEDASIEFVPKKPLMGDANDDGTVDMADARLIVDYHLGRPSNEINLKLADVDNNGKVTMADANMIVNMCSK